ncbi:MAG TPA: hypothetical protein VK034_21605 [Enhygromyxa sp.]|nr:hypothetical protein [Enhygromyxa sp.]
MRRLLGTVVLAALGCGPGKAVDGDTVPAEQVQYCAELLCFKALACDQTIEPSEDFEQRCRQDCTRLLEHANEHGCNAELQTVLECADAAECDPYLAWAFQEPGAACSSEEQQLIDACPDIRFREP